MNMKVMELQGGSMKVHGEVVHKGLGVLMETMEGPRVSWRVHEGHGGSMRVMEGS